MKIDITLKITPKILQEARENENKSLEGHLGTHFDVMDKEFPLCYTERKGMVFDVSSVLGRDVEPSDIDLSRVGEDMFVAFYSGFSETEEYGTQRYYKEHPQLSYGLIEALLKKNISVIGIDFAGVRRGKEHTPADQHCADRGVFIIENLRNLNELINVKGEITMHTYPMNCVGVTGLPCRVIAEID